MEQHVPGGSMSGKVRVYEVAKQLNLDPKQVVGLFQAIGVAEVRNHMSSVEPEAVERVKRHLEKQRTHDVVEERIRPTVVKRRAVAKPGASSSPSAIPEPAPSGASLPPSAPSVRALEDTVMQEHNGHAAAEPILARDRESGRLPPPEERKSSRSLEPPPLVPVDRASTRAIPIVETPSLVPEPPPAVERATDDAVAAAAPAPAPAQEPMITPLPTPPSPPPPAPEVHLVPQPSPPTPPPEAPAPVRPAA